VRFWDTSAIVPLLVAEVATPMASRVLRDDPELVVWWGTGTECISAIAREERIGLLADEAIDRLDVLSEAWLEVAASIAVRRTAARLLRVHSLRAADSLQLAAAIVASEGDPRTLPFVTLDTRLAEVASREGFPVVIPGR
jgi:predicted nucleic acid-binding protein